MAIDPKKHRDEDIAKITQGIVNALKHDGVVIKENAEETTKYIGIGAEKGIEDSAKRIMASSAKITDAFKELTKKIKNQKDIFNISLGGKNVVVDIDFSDIDIETVDFQKQIEKAFEKVKTTNTLEFDTDETEKQFKNIVGLYSKYALKLRKLQMQMPQLTSKDSIQSNTKEQLAIIDGLKEIQSVINHVTNASITLPRISFGNIADLQNTLALLQQIEKGANSDKRKKDTTTKKLAEKIKQLEEENALLKEKAEIVDGGQVPPARKPGAKKPKADTPAPVQKDPGTSSLEQLKKDAEASSKAFHEADKELSNIVEKLNKINEQIQNARLVDYAEKIKDVIKAKDDSVTSLGSGFAKKSEHKDNVGKVRTTIQGLIDKEVLFASSPDVFTSLQDYELAVADYSKNTNKALNEMLDRVIRDITRDAQETISTYKAWDHNQVDEHGLIEQRRQLEKEREKAVKVYNETADKSNAAVKVYYASEEYINAIETENARITERNRLIDEYIKARRKILAIESKYGARFKEDVSIEDYNEWAAAQEIGREISMRTDSDDVMHGVTEQLGKEMQAFVAQFESFKSEFGDGSGWLGQANVLVNQIQQGALTATDAVVKLREEMTRIAAEKEKQKLSFTDGTPLDEKEAAMVAKYLDIMKKKMGENYDEAMHLNTALDLVFNIKNRNIEEIMGRFTNGNDASNAVLNMATNMPINNQKNRDVALRSLNAEEYDRIIAERKAAVSKDKTEFQKKWEELASAMIGGDAFKDESNLNKGKIAKAFESLGGTAKEGIDQINKMWLAGELEGKEFKDKYIQSYVTHLNNTREYYDSIRSSLAGDLDVAGFLGGKPDAKLTEEKAKALRDEAAAYDELIAKKKEYYGIVISGASKISESDESNVELHETNSGQLSLFDAIEKEAEAKNKLANANERLKKSQPKGQPVEEVKQLTLDIDGAMPAAELAETSPEAVDRWLNGEETSENLDEVGKAAEKTAEANRQLANSNQEVAHSVAPVIEALTDEIDTIEDVDKQTKTPWSMTRPGVRAHNLTETSDQLDGVNLPSVYMGEKGQDAVQIFAKLKGEIEEMTGKPVIIDFVSDVNDNGQLEAVGATLKYVNEEAGVTVKQFYDVKRNQDGVLVATQSQEKATLAASKAAKVFNTAMQQNLALEQIKTLRGQMGSLEIDLTEVENAAKAINDKASLDDFNLALRAAKEQAKQLKTELKGQNTLDTIASMERALLTLPSRLEEMQRRLRALGETDGVDAIDDVLRSINEEYKLFLESDQSEDKVKLFRSLTSSMVWANAEVKNLAGKQSEAKKQETKTEESELAKQKAARESYISWWRSTLDEQAKAEAEASARQKKEQSYSDWWNKALLEQEQREKAKDERVVAARKKKEEAYEKWWLKALHAQEEIENRKADAPYLNYGKTTANSAERKRDNILGEVDALGVTNPEILAKINAYKVKVQEVIDLRAKFANDPKAVKDPELVKQFQKAAAEAEHTRRSIKAVIDEEQKMAQMSSEQGFDTLELSADQISNLKDQMIQFAHAAATGRVEIKSWDGDNKKLSYTVTDAKGAVAEMTVALGQGRNQLYKYRTATKETGTLIQQIFKGIKVKAKELISFVIGGGSIYKVITVLRRGIQYVREIDLALTELKKVTDETEEVYDKFLDTASKTAAKVGSTIKDVVSSTADWARLNI